MNEENVAFLIHALSTGGAERVMSYIAEGYNSKNKYLIVYHREKQEYDFDGKIISLDIKPATSIIGKCLNYIKRIHKLKKIKKELNIQKTISMLDSPNVINILSRENDKIVISLRNHKSKEFKGIKQKIYNSFIKFIYNKADKIISISEGVKEDAIKNLRLNPNIMEVIYNPINIEKIEENKKIELDDIYKDEFEKNNIIITSGRLTYQKGQWHLIRAFKRVSIKHPNIKLAILGKGELESELTSLINKLELNDKVILLGYQSNPFKYIYNSKMFVLTSLFEGFGNVILESMACGIPVISTDCKSGPQEIISEHYDINKKVNDISYEKYGVLVPEFNGKINFTDSELSKEEILLANSIIKLIEDDNLTNKYRYNGIKRAENFNMSEIIKKWEYA